VLDRHVRPRAGDDDLVALEAVQERLEDRVLPAVHAHLLDDEVAVLPLEPFGGLSAPAAANECVRAFDALEERRVELQPWGTLLDDVPDVDYGDAGFPARIGEPLAVCDGVLILCVLRRPGFLPRAAFHHHVVLHVQDDQRRPLRVDADGVVGRHDRLSS
jgi:hypothetical protein